MELISSFGYWLRRRRKALDLTQDELAHQAGCALGTLKKIETDERRPSKQLAERLADYLEIPATERVAFLKAARSELAVDRLAVAALERPEAARSTTPLPAGTVTFLFTDIEGSTRLWERQPPAMEQALARHDALLRAGIAANSGVVVKSTGDGIHAVFARATDAVHAALAAQRSLSAEAWGALGAVRVRIALHSGVTEQRDGDYFGPALNRIARLLAAGHGGQILLSLATAELVREYLPPESELRELGTHRAQRLDPPRADLPARCP